MRDTFHFPATASGHDARNTLAAGLTVCGITFELGEVDMTHGSLTFHVLTLVKTGKRANEGQIARDMKARKV